MSKGQAKHTIDVKFSQILRAVAAMCTRVSHDRLGNVCAVRLQDLSFGVEREYF